jgi:hypothetical protein
MSVQFHFAFIVDYKKRALHGLKISNIVEENGLRKMFSRPRLSMEVRSAHDCRPSLRIRTHLHHCLRSTTRGREQFYSSQHLTQTLTRTTECREFATKKLTKDCSLIPKTGVISAVINDVSYVCSSKLPQIYPRMII